MDLSNNIRKDTYWFMNKDLTIEKTKNNEKVYDKIMRQVEVIIVKT